jgi:hypothetical protein
VGFVSAYLHVEGVEEFLTVGFSMLQFFLGSCIFVADFPIQMLNFVVQMLCVMDFHEMIVVSIYIVAMSFLFKTSCIWYEYEWHLI